LASWILFKRVTFDIPPLNIFGPKAIPQLNEIITAIETDQHETSGPDRSYGNCRPNKTDELWEESIMKPIKAALCAAGLSAMVAVIAGGQMGPFAANGESKAEAVSAFCGQDFCGALDRS
jgi:hypothetical protein